MSGKIWFIDDTNKVLLQKQFLDHTDKREKLFILLDENTRKYCLPLIIELFPVLKEAEIIEIKSGEDQKTLESCTIIWEKLTKAGADRSAVLINLGGGVICDMGGFAASVFKRGIRFYHCPTTLLAQADASIGGKTAIDFRKLKNHLGLFVQAESVIIYPEFLNTQNNRQFLSGFAEIIKIALIHDADLLQEIFSNRKTDFNFVTGLIKQAVQNKISITAEDFTEKGKRKLLNFGHTLGHAIESLKMNSNNPVLHGEAVAAGMICETFISLQCRFITQSFHTEVIAYILSVYGKIKLVEKDIPVLLEFISHDKKNKAGMTRFTLLTGPGRGVTDQEINNELQAEAVRYYIGL